MLLFILASIFGEVLQAQGYLSVIDSLKQDIKTLEDTPKKVERLNDLSYNYIRVSGDSLMKYAKQAYQLSLQIRDKQGQVIALKNMSSGYTLLGAPYDSLLRCYRESVEIAKEIEDYRTISVWNNNLAFSFRGQKDYFTALKFYFRALEVFDEHIETPDRLRSLILGNIGQTLSLQSKYEEAIPYLEESISYAEVNDFEKTAVIHIGDLAKAQYYVNGIDQALATIEDALKRQRVLDDKQAEMQTLVHQAEILKADNPEAAKQSLLTAYAVAQDVKIGGYECMALIKLSELALFRNQTEEAMKYVQMATDFANRIKRTSYRVWCLRTLQAVYAQKKDYKQFFLLEQEINKLEQEIEDKFGEKRETIAQYHDRQHQIEVERYKKEQSELKYSIALYLLLGLGIALAFIGFFFYKSVAKGKKLKQANAALKIAKEEALAASQAKQDFLSVMSHEIRTPMNAVIGFTDILLEETPQSKQIPFLKNLKLAGEQLMHLINDVLDLSKLNANKVELEYIPFDLKTRIQTTIDIFKTTKNKDRVQLELKWIDEPLRHHVIGDPVRLNQILSNLISNAIKFTHEGKITLQVQAKEAIDNKQHFSLKIIDTGIGIPTEKQQSIFDDFTQATNATTREYGGTGLGLSITRQLVELHGSQIQLESKKGQGSVFSFDITYELGHALSPTITHNNEKLQPFENLNVLVAEDNVFNQKVVENILRRFGVKVIIANNGIEAIEKTKEEDIQLIIMDLHMPKMNGLEAIKEIRQLPYPKRGIPMILLTAEVLNVNTNDLTLLDVVYVNKPFQAKQLYAAIKDALLLPVVSKK